MDMMSYEDVRRRLFSITGFDVGHYNPDQMRRLLSTLMLGSGTKTPEEYLEFLQQNPRRIQDFKSFITINVSECFRDKPSFEYLRKEILPGFSQIPHVLQVWSAGCAQGEEAYSLAILFEEQKPAARYRIWATDVDDEALAQAREGIYPAGSLKNVPAPFVEKYFLPDGKKYRIVPKLKCGVKFYRHDLLTTAGIERFDLILCRNVVIYFTPEAKRQIYKNLHEALRPGGILFIGSTETLLNYRELGFEKIQTYFYRKLAVPGRFTRR